MVVRSGVKGRALAVAVLVMCGLYVSDTFAETTERGEGREEKKGTVVVTAMREERLAMETPATVSVQTGEVLTMDQVSRSVPECLSRQAGVMVQKTGHGQGSPYIRGFTGFRNLMMIDGIRLNNSVFRDGPNQYWNTVDMFGANRIETARGPLSVLYGSDAIGGTVNVLTRGIGDIRPNSEWDRRLYYRYSTAEGSHVGRLESISKINDNGGLTVGLTAKSFGDLRGGKDVGVQDKTGYQELDWDVKYERFLSEDSYLVFAHQDVDQDDAWRAHKTIYGIDWEGLSVGSERRRVLDQDRTLTYAQYHAFERAGVIEELHAGVSYHAQSEERDRLRSGGRHDVQGFDLGTVGAFANARIPTRIGSLITGLEYYHDDVDSSKVSLNADGSVSRRAIQGPVADDATYDQLGIFVQDAIKADEATTIVVGARYEQASVDAESVEDPVTGSVMSLSDSWSTVVGSARFLRFLDQPRSLAVYGGLSQGFRAPNLSDLTRLDSVRTDEIETPSPDLDPEYFTSVELGLKLAGAKLSGQIAVFHTMIDGMIIPAPTGRMVDGENEVTKVNAGDGYVQGAEAELAYAFTESLTAFGTLTITDSDVDTYPTSAPVVESEPMSRTMPPTGRVALRWAPAPEWWVEGTCRFASKADKLSSRDESDTSRIPPGGTPSYTVYDVRAGWDCTDDLSLTMAVENLANEDYRIHGSGVNEAGLNVIVAGNLYF